MTAIGAVFAAAFVLTLILRPAWLIVVVSLAIPFQNTAMVVLGPNSVTVFWGGVLVVCVRLAWLLTRPAPRRVTTPFAALFAVVLGLFVVYCVAITAIGPSVFHGMSVYVPRFGIDDQVVVQGTLAYGVSMIAQVGYLLLAVALVAYVMFEPEIPRSALVWGLVVGLAAALIRQAVGPAWPSELLENMPNIFYSVYEERARGTFAEPSGLAAFLAAGFAYFTGAAALARGWARAINLVGVFTALVVYAFARAGTALAGIAGALLVGAVIVVVRLCSGPVRLPRWARPASVVGALVLVASSPAIYLFSVGLVREKSDSISAISRAAADRHALQVFLDTHGVGVGLGGNRPSSLAMLLLSTVGVPGTVLFVLAAVIAAVGASRDPANLPYVLTLVAVLSAGLSSKPDLSEPMLWTVLALCARAGADADARRLQASGRRWSSPADGVTRRAVYAAGRTGTRPRPARGVQQR